MNREEDSGQWKPDPEKGECGEDLRTQFIVCNEPNGCNAKRNEFPYMVCRPGTQVDIDRLFK